MTRAPPGTSKVAQDRVVLKTLKVEDRCKAAFEEYCRGLERAFFEERHELRRVTQTEALKRLLELPEAARIRGLRPRRVL